MILITGCAGFIGSHLSLSFLKDGYKIVGIDNFDPYYDSAIKKNNLKPLTSYKTFHFEDLDITNVMRISDFFKKHEFEAVIHLAARPGVSASLRDPLSYERINIYGTLVLLEGLKKSKNPRLIFCSSSSVYGAVTEMPFEEDIKLSSQLSPYGASKWAGETFCRLYHDLYGIPVTILRLFTVYGPRVRPDMAIYKFAVSITRRESIALYNRGEVERDYTYIDDIVAGIRSAEKKSLKFETINLGNNRPIKIKYLVELLEKNLGKTAKITNKPLPQSEMEKTFAAIEKAQRLLLWKPKVSIEEGVRNFVRWYKDNTFR